ncbi:50S ribosomal protein P1 [Halocatena halophila]|uniref:50S ribosomal protein P1 n=1 Tax=Halocatena halophila TaxID=2814576 RepID=UPI002ED5D5F2
MEYIYAALILNESDDEDITEENVTAVLEAAGVDVEESRVKALIAALEDVDIEEAVEQAAAVPAGGAAPAAGSDEGDAADADDDDEAEAADADDDDDEEEEASGEGLGQLFG